MGNIFCIYKIAFSSWYVVNEIELLRLLGLISVMTTTTTMINNNTIAIEP